MVELTPKRVAAIKGRLAEALAREMGYEDTRVRADLGSQLEVGLDGADVRLSFQSEISVSTRRHS
ncbi:MAG: hypothetical protein M3314_02450 [Actinomycetota bacterium]|nr:hypothetical protein [Actinomycetota bacterium]